MRKTPPDMTPAEFGVMKILWRLGEGTVAEVRDGLDSELAYTTVMTLLGRLATKGAVAVNKSNQPFVYRPAFRREWVLRERLKSFLDNVYDGEASSLVLSLVHDEALSADELRRIARKIDTVDDDDDDDDDDSGRGA